MSVFRILLCRSRVHNFYFYISFYFLYTYPDRYEFPKCCRCNRQLIFGISYVCLHLPYVQLAVTHPWAKDKSVLFEFVFQKSGNSESVLHHSLLNKYAFLSCGSKNHLHQTPKQHSKAAETGGQNSPQEQQQNPTQTSLGSQICLKDNVLIFKLRKSG